MNKNEMIEEMEKIVDEMYNVYTTTAEDIAEGLYNAGYRKIDDNCAVITKSELKEYKRQAVKEFAERLKEHTILYNGINVKYEAITADIIDELLKEYK